MNSQRTRDKANNLMNEEAKELTVEFLMNQLAIEDCNAQHKILSQLNSNSSVNFAAYNHRQNKGKNNKSKPVSGKNQGQNNYGAQGSSIHSQPSKTNPRNGRGVYEMWKARAPARTEVCSQECQVQGMPLNRTLPQGMSIKEKRQESTSCPDSTTSEQTGHSH